MKIKVSNATGPALDWLVARCEGELDRCDYYLHESNGAFMLEHGEVSVTYSPSTDWSQGGPIIERERIRLEPLPDTGWRAYLPVKHGLWIDAWGDRATPLRVAMECFVASTLGDEVEVPEELL